MPNGLECQVAKIGRAMSACTTCNLDEVTVTRSHGAPPRGLILEGHDRAGVGCVVAGINPGRAQPDEVAWHEAPRPKAERGYAAQVRFFRDRFSGRAEPGNPYYGRLRDLAQQVGLVGPILWTDVVKCENRRDAKEVPDVALQRTCAHLHLTKELKAAPATWPVIAVGGQAFTAMCLLAPGRAVIGVPHASGNHSRPLYRSLFDANWVLLEYHRRKIRDAIDHRKAIQLKGTRSAART